jgi:hypothetical protein
MTNLSNTVNPDDIVLAGEFSEQHPHLFPAKDSLKQQLRNRKHNGLAESGAVVKRFNRQFVNKPIYMAWFAGQAE